MADLSTIFFNNPVLSDFILTVNGELFYLSSDVVAKSTDFFKTKVEHQNIRSDKKSVVVVVAKNVITIDDPSLKSGCVTAVLKSMYGINLDIDKSNATEIYSVSQKFQMGGLIKKCEDIIIKNLNYGTLLDNYLKAITEKSLLKNIYEKKFKMNLFVYDKDQIFEFILKLSYDDFCSLLQSDAECSETLMYDIVEKYCEQDSVSYGDRIKIMSYINLDKLSGEFLVTKVKNNRYINKSNYYHHLERIVLNDKKYDDHVFAFGKPAIKYPGYRIITEKECKLPQMVKLFADEYRKNNGLWSLDEFNADVLCNDKYPLCIENQYWIRLNNKNVNKNIFVQFEISNGDKNYFMRHVDEIRSHRIMFNDCIHNTRLFVSNKINF